jgi:hypothetical protein
VIVHSQRRLGGEQDLTAGGAVAQPSGEVRDRALAVKVQRSPAGPSKRVVPTSHSPELMPILTTIGG